MCNRACGSDFLFAFQVRGALYPCAVGEAEWNLAVRGHLSPKQETAA